MTTPINTSSFAKALLPGVKEWYGKAYDEFPVEYTKLFDSDTSRRNFEEVVGTSGMGLAIVKPEGSAVSYDSERQGFTTRFTHVVYALGFMITREMMEDDLYDVIAKRRSEGLAFSMRQTKEITAANVYNRAFNTSYTGGDASTLVACAAGGSASHANVTGGTWTNGPATASDLSEAALEQAFIDIQGFTNDRGLKIAVIPQTLVIPKEVEFDAARILKTVGRVGTDLNDINAIKELGKLKGGMVVNHYLTDTDAWFIRTNIKTGMMHFERRAMEFDMDNDFDTENAKFKATERYSFGWGDPRAIYGSPGA